MVKSAKLTILDWAQPLLLWIRTRFGELVITTRIGTRSGEEAITARMRTRSGEEAITARMRTKSGKDVSQATIWFIHFLLYS